MKKSLIAAAITIAVVAPSANASVILYGKIHASIDYVSNGYGKVVLMLSSSWARDHVSSYLQYSGYYHCF